WGGTGWRIADALIATNRHVASLFAERQGSLFRFRLNQAGKQVRTRVDFREEYRQPVPHQSMLSWSINSSRPTERIGVASAALQRGEERGVGFRRHALAQVVGDLLAAGVVRRHVAPPTAGGEVGDF
ncbi:hypothetical protein ACV35E_32595, partial [Pseudomonas aeruginosa]